MKAVHRVLDSVHTLASEVERSTRRKKRLRREHLVGAFHAARIVASGLAAVVPKVAPVAILLNGLNEHVSKKELRDAADSESDQ